MIKAIFFDIDGTLVSMKQRRALPSTINALNKARENGVKIFINTGRNIYEGKGMAVLSDLPKFDGYVVMNGQRAFMSDGKELFAIPIPREDIETIVNVRKEFPFEASFMEKNYVYLSGINDKVERFFNSLHNIGTDCEDISRVLENEIFSVNYFLEKHEEHLLVDKLKYCEPVRWHPLVADLVVKGGGKHKGIERVLEIFSFTKDEAMAIGDGGNDITMVQYAGVGVAMGNASDELKSIADYITTECEDDGIENALKHFNVI